MLSGSHKEYEEISRQVTVASESVTRYATAVIATSTGAFLATSAVNSNDGRPYFTLMALLTLVLLTLRMLSIINYRCASHNRLAAYKNMIVAEELGEAPAADGTAPRGEGTPQGDAMTPDSRDFTRAPGQGPELITFDICMDHLNHVESEGVLSFASMGLSGARVAHKGVFSELGKSLFIHLEPEDKNELYDQHLRRRERAKCKPQERKGFLGDFYKSLEAEPRPDQSDGNGGKELPGMWVSEIDRFLAEAFASSIKCIPVTAFRNMQRHDAHVLRGVCAFWALSFVLFGRPKRDGGKYLRGTWAYPDHVNRMVLTLVMIELAVALAWFGPMALESLAQSPGLFATFRAWHDGRGVPLRAVMNSL